MRVSRGFLFDPPPTVSCCSKFAFLRCFSTKYLPFLLKICVYMVFFRYFLAKHTAKTKILSSWEHHETTNGESESQRVRESESQDRASMVVWLVEEEVLGVFYVRQIVGLVTKSARWSSIDNTSHS